MQPDTEEKMVERTNLSQGLPILSMDVIQAETRDNVVIVAYASWDCYDFALNWVAHLQALGVSNFLVGKSCEIRFTIS